MNQEITKIKFGTDGWRAIIAQDFTTDNVARVAAATATWVKKHRPGNPSVVVGHDCRFAGELFAETATKVFLKEGIKVHLAKGFVSTPMISPGGWVRRMRVSESSSSPSVSARVSEPAAPVERVDLSLEASIVRVLAVQEATRSEGTADLYRAHTNSLSAAFDTTRTLRTPLSCSHCHQPHSAKRMNTT